MTYREELKNLNIKPDRLSKDLSFFYLSKPLINNLREFYTNKDKEVFEATPSFHFQAKKKTCKPEWPVCHFGLEKLKLHSDVETGSSVFRSDYLFSNFKFDYFLDNKKKERIIPKIHPKKMPDEGASEILIYRLRHICPFKDNSHERIVSSLKAKISNQICLSNFVKRGQEKEMPESVLDRNWQQYNEIKHSFARERRAQESASDGESEERERPRFDSQLDPLLSHQDEYLLQYDVDHIDVEEDEESPPIGVNPIDQRVQVVTEAEQLALDQQLEHIAKQSKSVSPPRDTRLEQPHGGPRQEEVEAVVIKGTNKPVQLVEDAKDRYENFAATLRNPNLNRFNILDTLMQRKLQPEEIAEEANL